MDPNINGPQLLDRLFLGTTFFLSLILNAVFLYLVQNYSSVIIRPYKRVLVVSAVADLLCAVTFVLVIIRPHVTEHEGRKLTLLSFDGPLPWLFYNLFGSNGLYYSMGVMVTCACFMAGYNCVPFVYRYIFVCSNHRVSYFQFFLMNFIVALLSLIFTFSSTHLYIANQKQNFPEEYMWGENKNFLPLMPSLDKKAKYQDQYSQIMRALFYISTYFILTTYGVTLYCGWKIAKFLRRKNCLPSVVRYNHQISTTLAIQAFSPIIAVALPGFFTQLAIALGYTLTFVGNWALFGLALIPIINPCSAMLLISCYRRVIFPKWVSNIKNRRLSVRTMSVA